MSSKNHQISYRAVRRVLVSSTVDRISAAERPSGLTVKVEAATRGCEDRGA